MANTFPDSDAFTAPFQLTKGMYRDVYPTVSPSNPDLQANNKVVIITGAAGGVGYAIAQSWSQASASGIVLVGRNSPSLTTLASTLHSPTLVAPGDISSTADTARILNQAMQKFGRVDVLINVAGSMNNDAITGEVDPHTWWRDFEVNVHGTYNMVHHFIAATGGKGTVINVVSLGASFLAPGISSYSASKLAAIKLGEYLDLEHPDLRVFSIHPGIVESEGGRGMVAESFTPFAKDKPALTGGVTLFLQTPAAEFLRGGFYSVNWDVDEMMRHQDEIKEKKLLQLAFLNGSLAPGGYPWST